MRFVVASVILSLLSPPLIGPAVTSDHISPINLVFLMLISVTYIDFDLNS